MSIINMASVVSIVVLVLILLINLSTQGCVSGSRAAVVDTSTYRTDWCRGDGARATKTTGECICLNGECLGPRCRRELEFVYYVYSECSTCICATRDSPSPSSSGGNDNDYVKTPLSKKADAKNAKKRFTAASNSNNMNNNNYNNNNNDNKNDDDNDAFSLMEFIEENARVVFACAFTSLLLLLFGMIISAMYSNKQHQTADVAIPKKAAVDDDDGKRNDKCSDKND